MPISSAILRMRVELLGAGLGREIALQIVVQFDAVEAGVLGQLQALPQGHPVRIRERPTG